MAESLNVGSVCVSPCSQPCQAAGRWNAACRRALLCTGDVPQKGVATPPAASQGMAHTGQLRQHLQVVGRCSPTSSPVSRQSLLSCGRLVKRKASVSGQSRTRRSAPVCRAAQALVLEEAPKARLDVVAFLSDSLPSQLWFGGYMQEARSPASLHATGGEVMSSHTEPEALRWVRSRRGNQGGGVVPGALEHAGEADTPAVEPEPISRTSNDLRSLSPSCAPHTPPGAGIVSFAAAALLVLGPAHGATMPPLPTKGIHLLSIPPVFDVRSSLYASAQQDSPAPPGTLAGWDVAYTATPSPGPRGPPAPNPLGPRLPVLVYDPDELLREPPREETTRSGAAVKNPVDLAESLQKGCGGPECFATLFRPSAELEGMGFAGAVVFGLVSERRKYVLAQLKDLVKVAEDQKHESEALVASLQQELEQQRSLLSEVLRQRGVPPSAHLSQQGGQAPPREKKVIGSREWMEGIGKRGLEALARKQVPDAPPATEHTYFTKMGQVHGYGVSRPRSLVPEGVSRVVDQTGRALGLLGEPSDGRQVAPAGEDAAGAAGGAHAAAARPVTVPVLRYVVPDTNQFLRNLTQIKRLREKPGVQTVVPLAVLKELDGLQSHPDKRAGALARKALRYMSQEMAAGVTWLRGQRRSEVRCLVGTDPAESRPAPEAVQSPREAWRQTTYTAVGTVGEADDALVDCCVHFAGGGSEVTLLTDDKTLQLKAMFHAVKARPITDFLAALAVEGDEEAADPVTLPASIATEMALHQLRRYEATAAPASPPAAVASLHMAPPDSRQCGATERTEQGAGFEGGQIAQLEASSTSNGRGRVEASPKPSDTSKQRAKHAARGQDSRVFGGEADATAPASDAAGQQEGRQSRGGRAKTGRGRATTSGQKGEETKRRGEDSGSEGEERSTRGGRGERNRTQGRKPRFAQTEAGKKEGAGPADILGLAERLNAQAREAGPKLPSSRSEKYKDHDKRQRQPP